MLAGVELRTVRYVVLVSLKQIVDPPANVQGDKGVTFRHVNVAIEPDSPSIFGKRNAGRRP